MKAAGESLPQLQNNHKKRAKHKMAELTLTRTEIAPRISVAKVICAKTFSNFPATWTYYLNDVIRSLITCEETYMWCVQNKYKYIDKLQIFAKIYDELLISDTNGILFKFA